MKLSKQHKSILVICLALLICYLKFNAIIILFITLGILITGVLIENFRNLLHKGWMTLAELLSRIMQPIILSVLFYVILTPIALVQRLFTKKSNLQLKQNSLSTFKTLNKNFSTNDFENPW